MISFGTKQLVKKFGGVQAINGLTLSFDEEKITSIIGPNGSGKTTLINVISGILPFDTGTVFVSGTHLEKFPPWEVRGYGITRTFQNVRLFEQMTVLDNLLVVLTDTNVWGGFFEKHQNSHQEKAKEILQKIGLWEKRRELASTLSYGQRKLLEVGRALSVNARIFLFDEPFAGLFPEMVKTIAGILHELREKGRTVVLIEHNMNLIRELSDHCIVMQNGALLLEGAPDVVLSDPKVMEAYLGE